MFCNHRELSGLNAKGYSIVRHPRANLQPGTLIARMGGAVQPVGQLQSLPVRSTAQQVLLLTETAPAAPLLNSNWMKVNGEAAAQLLNNFSEAFKTEGSFEVKSDRQSTALFEFRNINELTMDGGAIGDFLLQVDLDELARHPLWKHFSSGRAEFFILSHCLTSDSFIVSSDSDLQESVADKVSVVGASAKARLENQQKSHSAVFYSRAGVPLVFAFQALRIRMRDNQLELALVPVRHAPALAATATEEKREPILGDGELMEFAESLDAFEAA